MSSYPALDAHLFVCTHVRESGDSCGAKNSPALRDELKQRCRERWGKRVRVNAAGCLGHCEEGIATVIYPQARWTTNLDDKGASQLEQTLAEILDKP